MPEPFKIKCQYCGNIYLANKKNRTHCKRSTCREKEIVCQLGKLQTTLDLLCSNRIEAKIEVRLSGNDKLSHEAKIDSVSDLRGVDNTHDNNYGNGVGILKLIPYFRILLWKGAKGNFIIETYWNGAINPKILNQTFSPLANPLIIGNNLLVTGNEGEKRTL